MPGTGGLGVRGATLLSVRWVGRPAPEARGGVGFGTRDDDCAPGIGVGRFGAACAATATSPLPTRQALTAAANRRVAGGGPAVAQRLLPGDRARLDTTIHSTDNARQVRKEITSPHSNAPDRKHLASEVPFRWSRRKPPPARSLPRWSVDAATIRGKYFRPSISAQRNQPSRTKRLWNC